MTKHFSIAAHLVHSRLQLIPKRIDNSGKMEVAAFCLSNFQLIKKASASVERDHHIIVTEEDRLQAAELWIISRKRERENPFYLLVKRDPTGDQVVTSRDGGKTIIPGNPKFSYHTIRKAEAALTAMAEHHPKIRNTVFIETRWEISEY